MEQDRLEQQEYPRIVWIMMKPIVENQAYGTGKGIAGEALER
jgi:hypothetical protein